MDNGLCYIIKLVYLPGPSAIQPALGSLPNLSDSDEEDALGKKKSKRGVLPKSATSVMKSWLFQHIVVS